MRVKDVDFDRRQLTVRQGKGDKDRAVPLPDRCAPCLRAQLARVRAQHAADLERGLGFADLPYALRRKYPNAEREFAWQGHRHNVTVCRLYRNGDKWVESTRFGRDDLEIQCFDGEDRARIYLISYYTGLRRNEVGSLMPRSFDLDGTPPTVTVEAAFSKHRRKDILPLHPDLIAELRDWLATKADDEVLFPLLGKRRTWYMVKKDLERAGIPYETSEGIADFHAAGRHTHITELLRVTGRIRTMGETSLGRSTSSVLNRRRPNRNSRGTFFSVTCGTRCAGFIALIAGSIRSNAEKGGRCSANKKAISDFSEMARQSQ